MQEDIRSSLVSQFNEAVVDKLLEAYSELKKNYYLGGLRLAEVEGGRFAEAAFRLLQEETTGSWEPLGSSLNTGAVIRALAGLSQGSYPDSVRLHIPRALRLIYDVRNNRDAAHLGDGIDPNMQDATMVASVADWVLAEFIRLHHDVSAGEAQAVVNDLVTRSAPVIQDFDGFLKVLRSDLSSSERCLALLYQRGDKGAEYAELYEWAHPQSRSNLRRTLKRLVEDEGLVHHRDDRFWITRSGQLDVEKLGLLTFA